MEGVYCVGLTSICLVKFFWLTRARWTQGSNPSHHNVTAYMILLDWQYIMMWKHIYWPRTLLYPASACLINIFSWVIPISLHTGSQPWCYFVHRTKKKRKKKKVQGPARHSHGPLPQVYFLFVSTLEVRGQFEFEPAWCSLATGSFTNFKWQGIQ
jgi:hypothetical protein